MVAYSLALAVGLVLSAPWWLLRMATTAKYREGLRERLGFGAARLRGVVTGKRVVWVHAVSVGEVLAGSRLVADLGEALGPEWVIVISTTTKTGQTLARERFGAERVFYLPLDFAFAIRAWMRVLHPEALVLMESEVWPRLLHECKRDGVPVVVANARVSDRSFARAMKMRTLWRRVLRGVTLWLAQSEEDARRLREMGAGGVRAIGNLKFDVRAPKVSRVAELIKEAAAGRPIVVAGSTVGAHKLVIHGEPDVAVEEDIVLHAWRELPEQNGRRPVLVLAPRHPERFEFVATFIDTFYAHASKLESLRGPEGFFLDYDVVLLDTIGDLAAVYGIADVAFVGGSLVKRGGHNPLEPAQFGVPVVMGPSFENFRAVVEAMRAADGIAILGQNAEVSPLRPSASGREDTYVLVEELERELARLLTDHEAARAMGERGRQVFEAQQGATGRAVDAVLSVVAR